MLLTAAMAVAPGLGDAADAGSLPIARAPTGPGAGGGGGRGVLLSALSAAVYGRGRVAQLRRGLVSLDPSPGESQD